MIAGVGTVTKVGFFSEDRNIQANPGHPHSNYLGVRWHETPRNKQFTNKVFLRQSIWEVPESKCQELLKGSADSVTATEDVDPEVKDRVQFVLEKYLEDFIVSNFGAIFGPGLASYRDPENNIGQQFQTDIGPIDIQGIIVCQDSDQQLTYALKTVKTITVQYYSVAFKLSSRPGGNVSDARPRDERQGTLKNMPTRAPVVALV
jgi:hypothetical protein